MLRDPEGQYVKWQKQRKTKSQKTNKTPPKTPKPPKTKILSYLTITIAKIIFSKVSS